MTTMLSSDLMHSRMHEGGSHKQCDNKVEQNCGGWYFSRKEIEENSPSRSDGIDLKMETYLRKSYCTFLQALGMRLEVPQVTIATAIIYCHRFFLRQSHAKNDRRTVATVCMFLAGKVEETPHPLKDVILVSYEIIHKKDPEAVKRIRQKEVYEQQKEIILIGERVVLATLAFDFNVHHPYKRLVEAIKKFQLAQHALGQQTRAQQALVQVAWNFVNDGLRTSLSLQFKPHHIAAGAIFLAAKFLKVKLPSDGEKVWWQEFNVTPRQLEEVSNQMLELYEQNRVPLSQTSEVLDGSTGGGVTPKAHEEHNTNDSNSHVGPTSSDNPRTSRNQSNDDASTDRDKEIDSDVENNDDRNHESDQHPEYRFRSPKETVKKIDKDKVRAAFEKRRKERGSDVNQRTEFMDDDDLIERELEDGIELGGESEKRKPDWCNEVEDFEAVEEGEVGLLDDDGGDRRHRVPESGRKRKGGGSPPPGKRSRN